MNIINFRIRFTLSFDNTENAVFVYDVQAVPTYPNPAIQPKSLLVNRCPRQYFLVWIA